MKIYVVEGSTGEYSDRSEWLVRAYASEAKARDKVERCSAFAKQAEAAGVSMYDDKAAAPFRVEDPHMRMDYTGTIYSILEVEYEP